MKENIFTISGSNPQDELPSTSSPSHSTNSCNVSNINITNTSCNYLDIEANSICGTSEICDGNFETIHSRRTASLLLDLNSNKKRNDNSFCQLLKNGFGLFDCMKDDSSSSTSLNDDNNDKNCVKKYFLSAFPLIEILFFSNYSWKSDFPSDCITGFTVAIIQIVQGIAYALLVGTEPIIGLYTSFFPVLFYSFFGTSHHISLGTMAVVDIMLRDIVKKHTTNEKNISNETAITTTFASSTNTYTSSIFDDEFYETTTTATANTLFTTGSTNEYIETVTTLEILTSLSLLVGLIQIAFGFLKIGSVSLVFSDQLISGFSCGASISVIMSQIPTVFQLKGISKEGGPLSLVYVSIKLIIILIMSFLYHFYVSNRNINLTVILLE